MAVAEGIQGTSPCVQAENGGLGKSFEVSGWSNFVPGSLIHLWSHHARGGSWARDLQRCSLTVCL